MENSLIDRLENWLTKILGLESVGAVQIGLTVLGTLILLAVVMWLATRLTKKPHQQSTPAGDLSELRKAKEPLAEIKPLADQEPSVKEEPSAKEEPEADNAPLANASIASSDDVSVAELAVGLAPTTESPQSPTPKAGFRERLRRGVARTGSGFGNLFLGKPAIDEDLLEELETLLLMADVGIETTGDIIASISESVSRKELDDSEALRLKLQEQLLKIVQSCEQPLQLAAEGKPRVILVVGVNGVGKTTTIGKMAKRFQSEGQSVMLAAGDTFRAAAVEQLQTWGERNGVPVIAQHTGADSASVIFDALQSAKAKGVDVLIADTAGRLHNKSNLMEELKKITRVMGKLDEAAPHEVLLVLDAGTGQNALSQIQEFHSAVGVTGIALTKLDGTAKGGVIFPLCKKFSVPVRFIGVGESADDLQIFNAKEFVEALFSSQSIPDGGGK